MTISKRQFDLLQAMGITVWQRRDLSSLTSGSAMANANSPKQDNTPVNNLANKSSSQSSRSAVQQAPNVKPITLDLETLFKQSLFNDVIRCLGVSHADLAIEKDQLDLGIINWQFTDSNSIEFKHNCLQTPDLTTLANSPALKKALWQSIGPLSSL
ncbi:hypothetical protein FGD67_04875 [Colwellia sp. M166]|jgi:DNA polymerase III psi subunit|uniref:hypothetical protein n=1 Tax=Colwellia sp. M166 TaxID=2583805 RepID=UPI00211F0BFC|nr:hypothetical protein [Colwellia sp. M166]UUO22590.1 hypothetical protein FGD67_04875 [Colwellia sp. M166]|tara:strand:- start:626 stop:1093 length:468 start_codon:yes stop_codon:yes gene_type:complete